LVIVGALNWGAYALGHNLVEKLGNKNIQNSIYYLIAISGIVSLVFLIKNKGLKDSHKPTNTDPTTRSTTRPPSAPRIFYDFLDSNRNLNIGFDEPKDKGDANIITGYSYSIDNGISFNDVLPSNYNKDNINKRITMIGRFDDKTYYFIIRANSMGSDGRLRIGANSNAYAYSYEQQTKV
jgi:uncharacterized membrane protein YuzA (DUF378 family)